MSATSPEVPAGPEMTGGIGAYASTKQEILVMLKRQGQCDMQEVAAHLGVSRMAVHKHAKDLEARGLIERVPVRSGRGRPRLAMRLAPKASNLFPKAYAEVSCSALAFIEEKMGRKGVEEALRRRQTSVMPGYKDRVQADSLEGRVKQLTELRDEEGYMAESRGGKQGAFEIIEYNCPIREIAERYWEACTVENEMFRRVLKADVETTHRVVAGAHACQFKIRPRKG